MFRGNSVMVINTGTVLALSCPYCGKLNFHAISFFAFSGKKSLCFDCNCGQGTITITRMKSNRFVLKTGCIMCETNHIYYFNYKMLFAHQVMSLICLETGLEIGFIGSRDQVVARASQLQISLNDFVDDKGYEDYFDNPEIMLQALEYLNRITKKGSIKCKCGNNSIDLDILPDRLELVCNDCGNKGIIFAENKEDLLALKGMGKIELSEPGIIIGSMIPPPWTNGHSKK
jgi:hypothetical protein